MAITNFEIFEQFYKRIAQDGASLSDLMREYGGMPIYVPSWGSNGRNKELVEDYLINKLSPKELALKYHLSLSRVYEILGETRTPSLF